MSKAITLFDQFWSDVPSLFSRSFFESPCDIEETDELYRIDMELPGIKKKEVNRVSEPFPATKDKREALPEALSLKASIQRKSMLL